MPKGTSDDLYKLVQSLSKPEKVYFNTFSHAFAKGENPQHLHLFNLLCRQKKYNEDDVLNCFKTISQNHLSALKNQLQQQILKCLNDYHSKMNVEIELQEIIHSIFILVEKRLLKMTAKLLLKAKRLALDYEKYEYLHLLSALELRIIKSDSDAYKLKIYMQKESKKRKTYLENIENSVQYDSLSLPLWEILLDNSNETIKKNRGRVKRILHNPLLASPQKALSFSSKYEFYYMHSLCADFLNRRDEKLYRQQKEWLDYLEGQPQKLIERRTYFINAISRMILIAGDIDRIRETDFLFQRAHSFIMGLPSVLKNKNFMARVVALTNNYIHNQIMMVNPKKVLAAWENLKEMTSNSSISIYSNAVMNNNLSYAHFLLQEYHEALSYLNKVVDLKMEVRQDIQQQVRIGMLVVHYELNNLEQLPYMAKSVGNYFLKKDSSEFNKLILRYFERKISKITNKKEEREVFGKLKMELSQLPAKSLAFFERRAETFNFICWVESKISNKPYAEIVKEKMNKALND